jgi:hypothetical protein
MFKKKSSKIPEYSYRAANSYKQEEALVYRRIAIVSLLTAVVLTVIFFWGISFVNLLGTFWQSFSPSKAENANTTAIYRNIDPRLDSLPSITNKDRILVSGSVLSGLDLELFVNNIFIDKTQSLEGRFSFSDVKLNNGENTIKVISKDGEGHSGEPAFATITYDRKPPELEVDEISSEVIQLEKSKEIIIKGKTEPDSLVTVNGFQSIVQPDGSFEYVLALHEGQNDIKIAASDKAGNQTTIEKSVFAQKTIPLDDPTFATTSATPSASPSASPQ